jgi:hypothetical protein
MTNQEGSLGHTMARGDLESQELGSGARADSGKPQWGLMPLRQVCFLMNRDTVMRDYGDENSKVSLEALVSYLSDFQEMGDHRDALELLKWTMAYLVQEFNDPRLAFEEVIGVWEYGHRKYAAFNWMKGISWNATIGCYMRHIWDLYDGEVTDQESGQHHGAHLVCNAMMLAHYVDHFKQGNDLPTRWFQMEDTYEGESQFGNAREVLQHGSTTEARESVLQREM